MVCEALQKLGLTLEKGESFKANRFEHAENVRNAYEYTYVMAHVPQKHLRFFDESGVWGRSTRRFKGRAPEGEKLTTEEKNPPRAHHTIMGLTSARDGDPAMIFNIVENARFESGSKF